MPGTCFVIMGFGDKTDFATGRVLNLDKTYRNIIKPAAEAAGLKCVRADEIVHSGVIDVPMYEQLLTADVVIADLSTSNANALYELGVRHALRPYTTIVMGESLMKYPFDLNHVVIRSYSHLGVGIDHDEVVLRRTELTRDIEEILAAHPTPRFDSPVYTHLKGLKPPTSGEAPVPAVAALASDLADPTVASLMQDAMAAKANEEWGSAVRAFTRLRRLLLNDAFVLQQLALATYKSKKPDTRTALMDAHALMQELNPQMSSDPETLGLWGAIHKRLSELELGAQARTHLDEAIRAYEKGFHIKRDYYNGINLAYMLNVRARASARADAIADYLTAQRVRREVISICEALLTSKELPDRYWVLATLAEACAGLDDPTGQARWMGQAAELATESWMTRSTQEQLDKLMTLLVPSPLAGLDALTPWWAEQE